SAIARGVSADELRARLEALASPIDSDADRALAQAIEAARPRVSIVRASAFLPIEDDALRERILADASLREIFVSSSPAGGLLVREGVSIEELARALDRAGVVLEDTAP